MIRLCRLAGLLVLLVNSSILASVAPVKPDPFVECLEELGLKYSNLYHDTPELAYNRTCLTKCIYEKEGKLDPNGNFVLSMFPTNSTDVVAECINKMKATDICKKVSSLDTCITRNSDEFWKNYEECEKYTSYNDEFDDNTNYCYRRCQMIIDNNLDANGKVNFSSITISRNTINHEEALINCSKLVTDDTVCIRDLNMYYCVSYMLYHWSPKLLESEFECAKESNTYPFFGVQTLDTSRSCYDRCILIKSGDLNENDIKTSEYFKKLNLSETHLKEAFTTCEMTVQETDKCTKDLYFYDCINHLQIVNSTFLKKQKECALETNSTLVPYRKRYKQNYCYTRCFMIKKDQLDNNGVINKNNLEKFSINDTVIDELIKECNEKNKNKTCFEDISAYYCVISKIRERLDASNI